MTTNNKNNFLSPFLFKELLLFKKNVDEGGSGLHLCPFTTKKNKVFIYKIIFFLLSAIFAFASFYIYKSYLNLSCLLILGISEGAKISVTTLCLLLSFGSLCMAIKIDESKEIVSWEVSKIKRQGKIYYLRKKRNLKDFHFCGSNESLKNFRILRQTYEDFLEKISEKKKETLQTMQRIFLSKFLSEIDKEKLLNQAILELQFNLNLILKDYRND